MEINAIIVSFRIAVHGDTRHDNVILIRFHRVVDRNQIAFVDKGAIISDLDISDIRGALAGLAGGEQFGMKGMGLAVGNGQVNRAVRILLIPDISHSGPECYVKFLECPEAQVCSAIHKGVGTLCGAVVGSHGRYCADRCHSQARGKKCYKQSFFHTLFSFHNCYTGRRSAITATYL